MLPLGLVYASARRLRSSFDWDQIGVAAKLQIGLVFGCRDASFGFGYRNVDWVCCFDCCYADWDQIGVAAKLQIGLVFWLQQCRFVFGIGYSNVDWVRLAVLSAAEMQIVGLVRFGLSASALKSCLLA